MYNRYIPNQQGGYTRLPQQDAPQSERPQEHTDHVPPRQPQEHTSPPDPAPPPVPPTVPPNSSGEHTPRITDSLTGLLRHGLDQLHLNHVDTGDLLLLGLLFFLFREEADEELLVALGLLLIL